MCHIAECTRTNYLGKLVGLPHFSMQKRLGPFDPLSAAKPSYGTDDVPVTNWRRRRRRSLSNFSIAIQNHVITGWVS